MIRRHPWASALAFLLAVPVGTALVVTFELWWPRQGREAFTTWRGRR